MQLTVSGRVVEVEAEQDMPLLWVLRDLLDLTGTKYGCGVSACVAFTVRSDGQAVRSCVTPAVAVVGKKVVTIEALGTPLALRTVCNRPGSPSRCRSAATARAGAAAAWLDRKSQPTDADIDEAITNLCRCGTYQRVRVAIKRAAATKA